MCFRPATAASGPIECPNCGEEVSPMLSKCPYCGFKGGEAAPPAPAGAPSAPAAPGAPAASKAPGVK